MDDMDGGFDDVDFGMDAGDTGFDTQDFGTGTQDFQDFGTDTQDFGTDTQDFGVDAPTVKSFDIPESSFPSAGTGFETGELDDQDYVTGDQDLDEEFSQYQKRKSSAGSRFRNLFKHGSSANQFKYTNGKTRGLYSRFKDKMHDLFTYKKKPSIYDHAETETQQEDDYAEQPQRKERSTLARLFHKPSHKYHSPASLERKKHRFDDFKNLFSMKYRGARQSDEGFSAPEEVESSRRRPMTQVKHVRFADEEDSHPMKRDFTLQDRYAGAQKVFPSGGYQGRSERPERAERISPERPERAERFRIDDEDDISEHRQIPARTRKRKSRYTEEQEYEDDDDYAPVRHKSKRSRWLKGLGSIGKTLGKTATSLAPALLTSIPQIIQTSHLLRQPHGVNVDVKVDDDDDDKQIAELRRLILELKKRDGAKKEKTDEDKKDEDKKDEGEEGEEGDEDGETEEKKDTVRPDMDTHDDNYLDELERRGIDVEALVRRYGRYYV